MNKLKDDIKLLIQQFKTLGENVTAETQENLKSLFKQISENYFFQSSKYIIKIYSFYNLISKYSPLGDFNMVMMSQTFHFLCKIFPKKH